MAASLGGALGFCAMRSSSAVMRGEKMGSWRGGREGCGSVAVEGGTFWLRSAVIRARVSGLGGRSMSVVSLIRGLGDGGKALLTGEGVVFLGYVVHLWGLSGVKWRI